MPAAESDSFKQVTPERIGEFVTVAGSVKEFHNPPEPRAPYAFTMENEARDTLRVVVWPDIYDRVEGHKLLNQPGTSVTLTAEVADYKDKLELHLQDWEEITVQAGEAGPPTTAVEDAATTASSSWSSEGMTTSVAEVRSIQATREATTGTVAP